MIEKIEYFRVHCCFCKKSVVFEISDGKYNLPTGWIKPDIDKKYQTTFCPYEIFMRTNLFVCPDCFLIKDIIE